MRIPFTTEQFLGVFMRYNTAVWPAQILLLALERERTRGHGRQRLVRPELITWPWFDMRSISGYLERPPTNFTGKRPVLINIHGGPEWQFTPGFLGRNNFFLNELGVALPFPNVRGSSGHGRTFLDLDNVHDRENSVKDIGDLLGCWPRGLLVLEVGSASSSWRRCPTGHGRGAGGAGPP